MWGRATQGIPIKSPREAKKLHNAACRNCSREVNVVNRAEWSRKGTTRELSSNPTHKRSSVSRMSCSVSEAMTRRNSANGSAAASIRRLRRLHSSKRDATEIPSSSRAVRRLPLSATNAPDASHRRLHCPLLDRSTMSVPGVPFDDDERDPSYISAYDLAGCYVGGCYLPLMSTTFMICPTSEDTYNAGGCSNLGPVPCPWGLYPFRPGITVTVPVYPPPPRG